MIRRARETDLEEILDIEQRCYDRPWSRLSMLAELKKPHARMFVFEEGGRIEGYVVAYVLFDEGEIANIAVHPDRQGRGIAADLLKHALDSMDDVERVFLEVEAGNERAARLYEGYGFVVFGESRDYYGPGRHAHLMVLKRRRGEQC